MMLGFVLSLAIVTANAQGGGQGGGRMNEMLKQRLQEDLKLSDVKADSVLAIQSDFQQKGRQVRMDGAMSDNEKKLKMDSFNAERTARLKSNLTDDEIKKLDAFYEEMRKMRQNRPQN